MKKIITICLIVVTLLVGGMTATAKTTTTSRHSTAKSKSSSRTSGLTINDFCHKVGSQYLFKDNLPSIIESLGFKLVSSKRYQDDTITTEDIFVLCESKTYKKGGITIVLESAIEEGYLGNGSMTIKFSSSAEKKNFLKSATSIGFKKAKSNFYQWGKDYESGICIFVNGNDLIIGYLGD